MTIQRSLSELLRSKKFRQRNRVDARRDALRHLQVEPLEERRLLASDLELVGIQPDGDEFLHDGDVRNLAPSSLHFYFSGNQEVDPSSLDGIQVSRAGGDGAFGDANDVFIQPGYSGIGSAPNEVILRFAAALPDDDYRIDILGSGPDRVLNIDGDPFNGGVDQQLQFRLDLGAQIIAVVPQPIAVQPNGSLAQNGNQIVVYFNDDDLYVPDAQNPALYQLIFTNDTANNLDDVTFNPQSVTYDAAADRAVLTFASDIPDLINPDTGLRIGSGTFRLRIGTNEDMPLPPNAVRPITDVGSSYATAFDLGTLDTLNQLISSSIDAQAFLLDFPGGNDEPGHREIPEETAGGFDNHLNPAFGADSTQGITTILYNFKASYGVDTQGQPLTNVITEVQKQRAREALEVWSDYIGVQFLETSNKGMTIVTGDPRALDPFAPDVANHVLKKPDVNAHFIVRSDPDYENSLLILDNAQQWNDEFGADWYQTVLTGIGFMLGLERATDLPPSTLMAFGSDFTYPGSTDPEPIFPGNHDILHGLYLHRADSNDIDLYKFVIGGGQEGLFTAETFAERQPNSSLLDSHLMLYRENADGSRELIARNDDYFSEDSYIELRLGAGTYFLGVTASGNDAYNAEFEDTGFGGRSQGVYDLRVGFRPDVAAGDAMRDVSDTGQPGTFLDGDADGVPGGTYNYWFRAVDLSKTIIVDKLNRPFEPGIKARFGNIASALSASVPGDIVRIVPNGGADGNLSTLADNFGYEIGPGPLVGQILSDGKTLDVPKGVTVMVDAGSVFKLNQARIGVGSSSLSVDRSAGAFQVLGTPDAPVYFTSYFDESIGVDTYLPHTDPRPGNWGGLVSRNDNDNAEQRFSYEREGIFLNYVNHADIRYGGGNVVIDSQKQIVTPIQMTEARPTISFNRVTLSADAPMSADPDSFEETNFHAPKFQLQGAFTSDYRRVGPDIHGNLLVENSSNGLFVRITTPAGDQQKGLTVAGRFDDTDVVHILSENLKIQGKSGDPILELSRPPVSVVTLAPQTGGTMAPATYHYKLVNVDRNGFEGRPSEATLPVTLAGANNAVKLDKLPAATGDFVARRLYRSVDGVAGPYVFVAQINASASVYVDRTALSSLDANNTLQRDIPTVRGVSLTALPGGAGTLAAGTYNYRITYVRALDADASPSSDTTANVSLAADGAIQMDNLTRPNTGGYDLIRIYRSASDGLGPYHLAGEIPATDTSFLDIGETFDQVLNPVSFGVARARTDARLTIDPGIVVKLEGSRIETSFGAQLIAEGQLGREIIFTSRSDDRFGAGGTFDTNGDAQQRTPAPGDWGGLYIGHVGSASVDHALLTFGGGVTKIEGTFKAFNVLEIHQADVRLANSVVEYNADGQAGQGPADRFGRGYNEPATIFVRGAQPIIVNNVIQHNDEIALTINANSFTSDLLPDIGRSTGPIAIVGDYPANTGPLIRGNRLLDNPLNGVDIRGEVLTTQSTWDDTGIVHVLRGEQVIVPDFHSNVGLILKSSPSSSLVVKFDGAGDNFDPYVGAGITAMGRQLDIPDRIGGSIQIVGQPDFPVILTSLADDSVGAGMTPDGKPLNDTNDDGSATLPQPGDWRSVRLEQFANDRNVDLIIETEALNTKAPGENATPATAQFLGDLAPFEQGGDDNLRLGFDIRAVLNERNDIDVFSFNAYAGTEVWFDIDRTVTTLDTVVELIDADGEVVARSDNSMLESQDPSLLYHGPNILENHVNPLQKVAPEYQPTNASGLPKDFYSVNTGDAGMRVVLPGVTGVQSTYNVRVRSASNDLNDLNGGLTEGSYQLQVRLRETDEVPGVTVRYTNVRYATNGIELFGLPGHSPLLGEVGEDEGVGDPDTSPEDNNQIFPMLTPAAGPQDIGDLLASDRGALSIAGNIRTLDDIDFYEMQVAFQATTGSMFQHAPTVFDVDYASGLSRPDTIISVFDSFGRLLLIGRESNVADDRSGALDEGSLADLSRGSLGALDPFIGPVDLPEATYFVSVTSNARIPTQLLSNPNLRLEPVDSITRVAEDHIGSYGGSTAADPQVPVLVDTGSIQTADASDIMVYVLHDPGNPDESLVSAVELLTGILQRTVGPYPAKTLDLATRVTGDTYSFISPDTDPDDATTGVLRGVNTSNPQFIASRDDGILTFQAAPISGAAIPSDVGVRFHAMTYGVIDGQERLLAVGSRGDAQNPPPNTPPGPIYFTNILYQFDPDSGLAISAPQQDRTGNARLQGAGTQIVERGHLDTNVDDGPGGLVIGLSIDNGSLYALSESGGVFLVENPLSNAASLSYIGDVVSPAGIVQEVEVNNDLTDAQDLDQEVWTQRYDVNIGDTTDNTSTEIKHITIEGQGDDAFAGFFIQGDTGGLDQPTGSTFGPDGNFYVASNGTNEILRYDGLTGEFMDVFVTAGSGNLRGPREILFGPGGYLFVASFGTDSILRYDGASGAFINAFVTTGRGGLDGPTGMLFGVDGNLYVSSANTDEVLRFRGTNGQFINVFVRAGAGGLDNPHGLTFGPGGDLYVASRNSNSIIRYIGSSGLLREVFVPPGAGGLAQPNLGLRFGPDNHLYVSSGGNHQVVRYHGRSGALLDAYVPSGADSLSVPWGLYFDAEGTLFVNSLGNDRVLRYNDDTIEPIWQWQAEPTAADVAAGDLAGASVALSGDTLVVGAPQHDGTGAVFVYVRDDNGTRSDLRDDLWQLQATLTGSDSLAGDGFGTGVALDGNLLVVGAVGADLPGGAGDDAGALYVYRFNGTDWIEQGRRLTVSDAAANKLLGRELAVSVDASFGDTLVVGVPREIVASGVVAGGTPTTTSFAGDSALSDVDGIYNGLYVRWESGALAGEAQLITDYVGNTRTFTTNAFSAAPAVGDVFELLPDDSGAAYIFRYNPRASSWYQQQKLVPSDSETLDMFGRGVDVEGGTVLVGGPHGNAGVGAAYTFVRDDRGTPIPTDDTWSESSLLQPQDGSLNDKFGWSVALQGERALVGSLRDDETVTNSGSVYVYEYVVDQWLEATKLYASDPQSNDRFGASLDLDGTTVVVGAPDGDVGVPDSGSVYVFEVDEQAPDDFTDDIWSMVAEVGATNAGQANAFGTKVSLDGDTFVGGDPEHDWRGDDAGTAQVFVLETVDKSWQWQYEPTAADVFAGDLAGTSVALRGDTLFVGAPLHNLTGVVFVYARDDNGTPLDLRDDLWQLEHTLAASDGAIGDGFGAGVAVDGDLLAVGAVGADLPAGAGDDAGAVYVFRFDGTDWIEEGTRLTASDAAADKLLGRELAVSVDASFGDTLVVGVPREIVASGFVASGTPTTTAFVGDNALSDVDDTYNGLYVRWETGALAGEAQAVTDYVGNTRTFTTNAFSAAPAVGDLFEVLVADSGAAYVFRYDGATWFEQQKLEPSDTATFDMFGRGVDVEGSNILIGGPHGNAGVGAAYMFVRDDGGSPDPTDDTWTESYVLQARDGSLNDKFGWSVSLQGDRTVIGSPRDDDTVANSGSAYVYQYDAAFDEWLEITKLSASDPATSDWFGASLDLDGTTVVIGAPDGDVGVANSGSVYVFELDDLGNDDFTDDIWTMEAEVGTSHAGPASAFGTKVSLDGDTFVGGDPEHDWRGDNAGTAQVFVWGDLAQATFETFFVPFNTGGLDDPRQMVIGPDGLLYVVSATSNRVLRFDADTAEFVDIFIAAGTSGLDQPQSLAFGPDGTGDNVPEVFVTSRGTDEVMRFNGATGEFIDVFASLGLEEPTGLTFGPDRTSDGIDDLYVTGFTSDNVVVFNGQTGDFVSQFIPPSTGGLDGPMDLQFRPDGLLYIASANTNSILRYNALTGAFANAFVTPGSGGLNSPQYFLWGPDANADGDPELYVSSFNNDSVLRYNGRTGAFIDDFVYSGNEGLNGPSGLVFAPSGLLLVAGSLNDTIMQFDTAGTPTFDYFKFTVANDGDRGFFDIDFGFEDGDPGSFDAEIFILDAAGTVIATNDDASITFGAEGSESPFDSFVEVVFATAGEYYVVVGEFDSNVAGGVGQGNRADLTDTYTLHVSIENYEGSTFAGMAMNMRPSAVDDGVFFAINRTGSMYAFTTDNTSVTEEPIFNGQSRVATGIQDVLGITISPITLWHVTDERHADEGHGFSNVFDDSRGNASQVKEREPNDTIATAHDLEDEFWHLGFDSNIGDASDPPINTSTTIPHVTVRGSGDGTHDYYSFEVTAANTRGIFDIDMDFDEQLDPNDFMDAELSLYDQYGNLLAFVEDATLPTDGDGGKDVLWLPPLEPYMEFVFAQPGTYVLQVTKRVDPAVGPFILEPPEEGDFYVLQVSLENHRIDGPAADGGLSFFFGPELTGVVTDAVAGDPIVITSPGHGLLGGERVYVQDVQGIPDATGAFTINYVDDDNFELVGTDATGTYLGGGTWRLLQIPEDMRGELITNPFSLLGYSPEDKPVLYFNYLLDADAAVDIDVVSVSIIQGNGLTQPLVMKGSGLTLPAAGTEAVWRQARVELDDFANMDNLRLLFSFDSGDSVSSTFEGFFLDDIIIGFAERGEMVSNALNDPTFSINPDANQTTDALTGAYQLEIRTATDPGPSQIPEIAQEYPEDPADTAARKKNSEQLTRTFDTNERFVQQTTIVPPSGSDITDGQTFTISDGVTPLVFEFDDDGAVEEGHVLVAFQTSDSSYDVAQSIRDAVNSPAAQAAIRVIASTSAGTIRGTNFADGSTPSDPVYQLVDLAGTAIVSGIQALMYDGVGDSNRFRDQGQVLIHSNFVTDSRDFGIVADAGVRDMEPGVPVGFLEPHMGVARNLRELNSEPDGGLVPGALIENNVISGEGLGGIHVSGDFAPFEIVPPTDTPAQLSGQFVCDGQTITIHAYRTDVTFEFEDISAGAAPCGSTVQGGDGWTEGNIPIFYRQSGGGWLSPPRFPAAPYSQVEMAVTIRDAIQSSILVTNGTTLHVDANLYDSRWLRDPFTGYPLMATYVSNVSSVDAPSIIDVRRTPLGQSAQPFYRVLNNTVYGNDGSSSFFPGSGYDESNDTMETAVETQQGRQHNPELFISNGTIGDSLEVSEPSLDVDFYRFELNTGERVTIETGSDSSVLVNNPGSDQATSGFTQSETSMLVFGNRVLVGFNDSGSAASGNKFTGYSLSLDGGQTFTDMGELPTNPNGDSGDPVLARDESSGTVYFATLTGTSGPIEVFRSLDGGSTFTAPIVATPGKVGFQDKPWMTVDNFAGPGQGNVYVTATDFGSGNGIYFFRSTNGGNAFGPSGGTLIASGTVQGSWVTVGADHTVYVFYYDGNTAPQTIKMRKSFDFGLSFGAEATVAVLSTTGVNGNLGLTVDNATPTTFRSNSFPQVVVNPVNGHLYMTYNDNPTGLDKADIYFLSSTDGGATWSPPARVNSDVTTNDQWQPTIAVTPNGENVGIFWYDRRLSLNNGLIDYFGRIGTVVSTGVAFRDTDFRITDQSFAAVVGIDPLVNTVYMGDYDQAGADDNAFYTVWADNSLGTPDVRFARVPLSGQQGEVEPALRLFDNRGQELARSAGDGATLDYTALSAGTYYVGVSGVGNEEYDPLSFGNRTGPASVGDYQISINVIAPRTWVITARDGAQISDGSTFTVDDINGSVTYEFDDVNAPGITAGNIPIVYDSTPIGQANRGPGYRPPDVAVAMASTIGEGLTGVTAVALGGVQGASWAWPPQLPPLAPSPDARPPQLPTINGDTSWWGIAGFGHDTPLTPVVATGELYVVVTGATRITGSVDIQPMLNSNIDQVMPETGILVSERSSPTLLNNVLANLNAGIWQDSSPTTVVGASIYQHNEVADSNVGSTNDDFNIHLDDYEPLFVHAAAGNFYPAARSRTIDSAIDSLEERSHLATVKNAVGIPVSPILAPDLDAVGLLRSDDPEVDTPSGQGANVFKDRGGLDRADFAGPDAVLIDPRDNDVAGIDLDPTVTVVQLASGQYKEFAIQLVDGLAASESGEGTGVNDLTVDSNKVTLTADGRLLQEDVDYTFQYNATTNTIRLTPLAGAWDNATTYVITLPNEDRFVVEMPDGSQVSDSETFVITDLSGGTVTFEFESGFSLFVPATLTIYVPAAGKGPGGVQDGQRFTVRTGPVGPTYTFEYDNNVPPNFLPGNIPIDISSVSTVDEVAQITINALIAAGIGVTPRYLGAGQIHFGAPRSYSVDTSLSSLTQSGTPGVVADGQTIVISDGVNPTVTFEFDSNNVVVPGRVRIPFSAASTQDDIAQATSDAIGGAPVGLTPTKFIDGHVHLGGTVGHTVNIAGAPNLSLTGKPGVRPSTRITVPPQAAGVGGIADDQWFSIDDGTQVAVFEFDSDGLVMPGARPILFTPFSTRDQISNAIVSAINLAGINLSPIYLGSGVIALNDTIHHKTDTIHTKLTKTGVPGGVVTVAFLPDASFDATQFAPLILDAIADSELTDVTLAFRGDATYFINGVKTVSGLQNFFIGAIEDNAGNNLQPNQPTNETKFTILMPGVQFDFGDAPGSYGTLFDANGARHVIPANPLLLGQGVTTESDGQPSPNADADVDDGVDLTNAVFNKYVPTEIVVTANGRGYLDAWIDYNQDGDWEDPGEQVFASMLVSAGDNTLFIQAPESAQTGQTIARFRISTLGGLNPTGIATDGEVEDYVLLIEPGIPPVANDDAGFGIDEDNALAIYPDDLLANDTDSDTPHDQLSVLRFDATSAFGATVSLDGFGLIVYDPTLSPEIQALNPGEELTDTFTYQATDGVFPSNNATVSIVVTGLNDVPVAVDDDYATDEDTVLNVGPAGVLTNDYDVDRGDTISVSGFDATSSMGAAILVNSDGSFRYDPTVSLEIQSLPLGATATDTFTYTIEDSYGATNSGTVTVNLTGLNDAPTAVDDEFTTDEDTVLDVAALGVLENDSDIDGDVISVLNADATSALGAPVTVNADGSFSYDPTNVDVLQNLPEGASLDDTFTYTITDVHGATATATVTVHIDGRNDPPTAMDDQYATFEDQVLVVNPAGVLANDFDRDIGDTISVDVANTDVVSAMGASVSVNASGGFTYDPTVSAALANLAPGEIGYDTFTYTLVDNHGATDTATVTIEVTGVNSAPVATDKDYTTDEDTVLNVPAAGVMSGDYDPDGHDINLVTYDPVSALGAPIVVNPDGSFTYDPTDVAVLQAMNVGDFMTDTFSYTITDDYILPLTATATISIEVEGLNDAPVAVDDQYLVPRNGSQNLAVLVNDYDIDGTLVPSSVTVTSDPSHGIVTVLANGSLLYTPTANYSGSDLLKYTVLDNSGAVSNEATVSIRVNGAPVAVDDHVQTFRNVPITINVLANDHDDDGTLVPGSVTIVDKPRNGTATVNSDGTVLYRPRTSFVGNDSFTYTVRDNDGVVSNKATVSVGVIIDEFPWTNPINRLDVNNDGSVSPIDALLVINDLNFNGPRILPNPPVPPFTPPPFLDTSGDNQVSPIDALLVINYLNSLRGGSGEGEGEGEGSLTVTQGARNAASSILIAAPSINVVPTGSLDSLAADPVAPVESGEPTEADDDGLMIGSANDPRRMALDQYLSSSAIEEALEDIVGELSHSEDDELLEDMAMLELLFGKQQ